MGVPLYMKSFLSFGQARVQVRARGNSLKLSQNICLLMRFRSDAWCAQGSLMEWADFWVALATSRWTVSSHRKGNYESLPLQLSPIIKGDSDSWVVGISKMSNRQRGEATLSNRFTLIVALTGDQPGPPSLTTEDKKQTPKIPSETWCGRGNDVQRSGTSWVNDCGVSPIGVDGQGDISMENVD